MTPGADIPRARILIVDDHDENLLALEAVLDEPRYEIVRANSGHDALRAALKHDFAVVLLDVAMPGMDGYETATLLRDRDRSRDTPIIFLTANYRTDSHMTRGYSAGAVDYMFKPFAPDALRSKVAVFVELFEKREALRRQALALQRAHDELEERVRERTAELAEAHAVERELRGDAEQINRLKDEFLATLSHELRTPLNAILGWTHILELPTSDPAIAKRAVAIIKNNAVAQSQIVEDILDVSRIISGKLQLRLEPTGIPDVLGAAIDAIVPAAEAKGITLDRDIPAMAPAIVDRDRLQQICWNLLSNAVKFTPKGGRVTLAVTEHDGDIVVTVSDTGLGITQEFLPRIFERFTQADGSTSRQHGGLGLGMAIVRHLVELHGGTVQAESPGVDLGATFTVRLPRRDALDEDVLPDPPAADRRASQRPIEVPSLGGLHVLLVDADSVALASIESSLRDAGAEVTAVASGGQALALLEHHRFSVLVSALDPPGVEGAILLRRARERASDGDLPAIALVTLEQPGEGARALESGFDLHVAKPVDIGQLASAIDTVAVVRRAS